MLNKSAATDARHSRSGKDAMLYNSAGKPFAQVESFTTKGSFNNYKYAPLGQNRELEVNGTVLKQLRHLITWLWQAGNQSK